MILIQDKTLLKMPVVAASPVCFSVFCSSVPWRNWAKSQRCPLHVLPLEMRLWRLFLITPFHLLTISPPFPACVMWSHTSLPHVTHPSMATKASVRLWRTRALTDLVCRETVVQLLCLVITFSAFLPCAHPREQRLFLATLAYAVCSVCLSATERP